MHNSRPATAVRHHRRCASLHRKPLLLPKAARSPCVLVTAPQDSSSLQHLAKEVGHSWLLCCERCAHMSVLLLLPISVAAVQHCRTALTTQLFGEFPQVRQQLGIEALVVVPDTPDSCVIDSSTSQQAAPAASFTFGKQLQIQPCTRHEHTFKLSGATSADCVLCAVDQTHGLMQALSLSPVLVLVGVSRGPALSSGELL